MPGFANRYTSMPGQPRALVCPDRGVTPGIRPYARCHSVVVAMPGVTYLGSPLGSKPIRLANFVH